MMYFLVSYNLSSRKVIKNKTASLCFYLIHCVKFQDI